MSTPIIEPGPEFKHANYELFIFGLSAFSIANLILLVLPFEAEVKSVVLIADTLLCIGFLVDFAYRLVTAPDRRAYLRIGWSDFLGSLPVPGFRLFRLFRMRLVRRAVVATGGRAVVRALVHDKGGSAILAVLLLAVVTIEVSSILMVAVEASAPGANITTGGDALWWAWVSVTTVGYGDQYPVTPAGRMVGAVLLAVGIALFSTITGFLATRLTRNSVPPHHHDAVPGSPVTTVVAEAAVEGEPDATLR